jgi:hypothetical protein
MKIFRRIMRTNAPAALRPVWADVRMQLGLLAVGSFVTRQSGGNGPQDDSFAMPWQEMDTTLPKGAKAALGRFLDGFAAIYSGACHTPPCDGTIRSSIPFKITRDDPGGKGCACCRRLFDEDVENTVNDVLVVPRSTSGSAIADNALIFCSGTPLDSDEVRFLHTSAGLYFAQ